MYRRTLRGLVLSLALLAATTAAAATPDDVPRLDENTALMVGAKRLKLGLLAFEYGIVEKVSVGTDPPAWAARAFLPIFIPNLHLKVQLLDRQPVVVAVQGAIYYVVLDEQGSASGSMITVPLSLYPSVRAAPRVWLHGELTYVLVEANGSGDYNEAGINGGISTRAGQAGLMLQVQVTRIFSILARGRYQFYSGPLAFNGGKNLDPYTNVAIDGQALQLVEHPWMAIAGVALLWRHVHLTIGAGYGYYFVPGVDLVYPTRGFVPDASLAVIL